MAASHRVPRCQQSSGLVAPPAGPGQPSSQRPPGVGSVAIPHSAVQDLLTRRVNLQNSTSTVYRNGCTVSSASLPPGLGHRFTGDDSGQCKYQMVPQPAPCWRAATRSRGMYLPPAAHCGNITGKCGNRTAKDVRSVAQRGPCPMPLWTPTLQVPDKRDLHVWSDGVTQSSGARSLSAATRTRTNQADRGIVCLGLGASHPSLRPGDRRLQTAWLLQRGRTVN